MNFIDVSDFLDTRGEHQASGRYHFQNLISAP